MYITADGGHMIVGDLYAIGDDLSNVTEQRRVTQRKSLMDRVAPSDMVIFPAKGERRAVVNIFTDVDCGYCRKLHNEIDQYAELGIEVRYLAYPREGLNPRRHPRCARFGVQAIQPAMTRAKTVSE